jgi:hypothetical protein
MDQQGDTRLTFHEGIERWQKRSNTAPMEPVDLARWPGDAKFENDISDSSLFNERYIESQIGEDELLDNTYLFSMLHTIFCLVVAADLFTNSSFWYFLLLYPVFNIFFFLSLRALARPPQRVRYNRQAQVVQTVDGKGNVVTVPWRSVRPFLRFKLPGRTKLELGFPPPPGNKAKIYEHKGVLWIDGAFDALGDRHIQFASLRFEFIRRYMEDGLDAIQPVPNLPAYKKTLRPTPRSVLLLGRVWSFDRPVGRSRIQIPMARRSGEAVRRRRGPVRLRNHARRVQKIYFLPLRSTRRRIFLVRSRRCATASDDKCQHGCRSPVLKFAPFRRDAACAIHAPSRMQPAASR